MDSAGRTTAVAAVDVLGYLPGPAGKVINSQDTCKPFLNYLPLDMSYQGATRTVLDHICTLCQFCWR